MKKWMHLLMLSCVRATALIEKKQLSGINTLERVQLFAHTSMCDGCKEYQKQSILLSNFLDGHFKKTFSGQNYKLSPSESTAFKQDLLLKLGNK
jgi:hypothetical protein